MATGKHPAMIYADQAIDGPVIGTLVVILDRGKNLPNRRSYGKQDPYCVVRLGKEGKRTEADKRGGQTPIWDKELRFTVRDSPDYKTLKITCFNEDKKTELIGECSIAIDKILVKGGGTEDGWRTLNCKGKYAGEISVELTFWDTRPKDDPKPSSRRPRDDVPVREKTTKGLSGPRSAPTAPPKERVPYRERISREERERVAKDRAARERQERMENERLYNEKEAMRAERERGKSRRRRDRANTVPAPDRYADEDDEDAYERERMERKARKRDEGRRDRANTTYADRDYVQTVADSTDRGRADRQRQYRQTMPPQGYDGMAGTSPSDYAYHDQQMVPHRSRRDRYYEDNQPRDEYYQDDGYGRRPDDRYDERYQQPLPRGDQYPPDQRIMQRPRSFVEDERRPLQIQQLPPVQPLQPRQTQRRPALQQIDNGPPPPPPPHRRLPALPPPDTMQDQIVARTEGSGLTRLKSLRHHKSATEFRHNDVDPAQGYANPHDEMHDFDPSRNGSYSGRHETYPPNDGSHSPIPPNAVALRNQHLQRHDSYVQYDDRNPLALVRTNTKFDAPKNFPPTIPPTPGIRKAQTFDHELGFEEKSAMVPLKRESRPYGGPGDPSANNTTTVATRTLHHVRSDSELSRKASQRDPRNGKAPIPYGRGSYVNPDDRSTPQIRGGIALPPSLVPGIDPTVADELTERMNHERRLSFNDAVPSRGLAPPAPYVEDDYDEDGRAGRKAGQGYNVNANRTVTPLPNRASQPIMEPVMAPQLSSSLEKYAMTVPGSQIGGRGAPTPAPFARPQREATPKLQGDPFGPESFNVLNPNMATQVNMAAKVPAIESAKSIFRKKNTDSVKPAGTVKKLEKRNPEDVLPPSSFAPEPEKKEKPSASGYPPSPYRGKGRTPSPQPPRNGRSPSPMPPRNGRSPSPMPPRNGRSPSPMPPRQGRSPSPMPPRNVGRTPSPQPPRPGEIRALPAPGMDDPYRQDMAMVPRYDDRRQMAGRQPTMYHRDPAPYASQAPPYAKTQPMDIHPRSNGYNTYGQNPDARRSMGNLPSYSTSPGGHAVYSNPSARHSTAALPRNYDDFPQRDPNAGPLAIGPPPDVSSLSAADLQREIEELQRAQQRLKELKDQALPYDSSRDPRRVIPPPPASNSASGSGYDDYDSARERRSILPPSQHDDPYSRSPNGYAPQPIRQGSRDDRSGGRSGHASYSSSPAKGPLMLPAPGEYYDDHPPEPGPGALVLSTASENYRDYQYAQAQAQQQQQQQNLSRGNSGGANGFTHHRNASYNNIPDTRREPSYANNRQSVYMHGNGSASRADLGAYDQGPPPPQQQPQQQQPLPGAVGAVGGGQGGDWDLTRELMAVSEEMKRIELGPGRGTARRRY